MSTGSGEVRKLSGASDTQPTMQKIPDIGPKFDR